MHSRSNCRGHLDLIYLAPPQLARLCQRCIDIAGLPVDPRIDVQICCTSRILEMLAGCGRLHSARTSFGRHARGLQPWSLSHQKWTRTTAWVSEETPAMAACTPAGGRC